jgi:hypothetical protein
MNGYEEEQEPFPEERWCHVCNGGGALGIVSREMAIDAGAPELEGQVIPCNYCGGYGWL